MTNETTRAPYVMQQMGHESSGLALEIYTKVMDRKRDTGAQMDALIRGADWAQVGTSNDTSPERVACQENKNPAYAGFS